MATASSEFLSFLMSELTSVPDLSTRRFFGGWQILSKGEQFAIVMKGTLFFKVEGDLQQELIERQSRPFTYTKSGKLVSVNKYMSAPEDALDDLEQLRNWAQRVIAAI